MKIMFLLIPWRKQYNARELDMAKEPGSYRSSLTIEAGDLLEEALVLSRPDQPPKQKRNERQDNSIGWRKQQIPYRHEQSWITYLVISTNFSWLCFFYISKYGNNVAVTAFFVGKN